MTTSKTILAAVLLLGAANAAHADLIANGTFATGDFTGWTSVGDASYVSIYSSTAGIYPNNMPSDQYHVEAGTSGTNFFDISQSIATTVGQSYTFSFYINETDTTDALNTNTTDALQVLWNGNTLLNISAFTTNGWQLYSFIETAGSSNSSIQFNLSDYSSYVGLADVSVVAAAPVPLSPTFYSFGLGLLSLLGFRTRAKR
jgi:hypothetical protein